jgi:hypothetical protein
MKELRIDENSLFVKIITILLMGVIGLSILGAIVSSYKANKKQNIDLSAHKLNPPVNNHYELLENPLITDV